MIAAGLIGLVGGVACGIFATIAGLGFGADLRGQVFRRIQSLSFGNLERLETGRLITRLTNDKGNDYAPVWSPDGSTIAFRSDQNGQSDLYTVKTDGTDLTDLTNNPADDWSPSWSPDGSLIAFQTKRDGNWEIYVMNADGSNPTNLTNNPGDDEMPYWRK